MTEMFPLVNCPFICSNIPTAHIYGVYVCQVTRYCKACGFYQDFLEIWFLMIKSNSSRQTFYVDDHDLVDR